MADTGWLSSNARCTHAATVRPGAVAPWRATTLRGPHWADATQVGRILPRELGIRDAQVLHGVDQVDESATEAVERPDDEHVARPERAHAAVESRAVVADAGREVVVDVAGVDARGPQRVALQIQRLGAIRLRDAGVADPPVS